MSKGNWCELRIKAYKNDVEILERDNEKLELEYQKLVADARKVVERMSANNVRRAKNLEGIYTNAKLLRINGEWVKHIDNS
ncbi:hypothetical protein [Bacillus sp. COPE52]|uniref:hypothetical protein n=1 Tax=Bacillus sp. COPE52 TaxID=2233998 RepID=UPI000E1039EE|nr:hypothetical protein [Bacillus sp. COPE52]AXK19145.1 hypothetical protein DPQ31_16175 [Bacillus sp. COPE52]